MCVCVKECAPLEIFRLHTKNTYSLSTHTKPACVNSILRANCIIIARKPRAVVSPGCHRGRSTMHTANNAHLIEYLWTCTRRATQIPEAHARPPKHTHTRARVNSLSHPITPVRPAVLSLSVQSGWRQHIWCAGGIQFEFVRRSLPSTGRAVISALIAIIW